MNKKILLLLVMANLPILAQIKIQKEVSTGFIISSYKNSPFLIRANQFGTVPLESGIGFFSGKVIKDYDSLYSIKTKKLNSIDYGFGIEPHINLGRKNQVLLPQAYAKVRLKAFELFAGRRKEIFGLVDTAATSGSYAWSGNALPVPKIEISIQNYTPILGNGLISIKGNFAHGWFGSTDSVKKYFLHHKTLYTRIGKPAWKAKVFMGINHNVQWGGRPAVPYIDKFTKKLVTSYGSDFTTFLKAATTLNFDKESAAAGNEALNRVGNHLGSVDLAVDITTKFGGVYIYRQSIYEDGSLFYLNNISDGLNGISFRFNKVKISKIGIEYLNTANQGGMFFFGNTPELRGVDNYFNNSIYRDGWTYKQNTIGTPLITIDRTGKEIFFNNRIQSINAFLSVHGPKTLNRTKIIFFSVKEPYYSLEASKIQSSIVNSIDLLYHGILTTFLINIDVGNFYRNNTGLLFKLTKKF